MTNVVRFEDLRVKDYLETWNYQERLLQDLVRRKSERLSHDVEKISHYLLFVEHPHVYTLGRSGSENNLLLNTTDLKSKGVSFYHTNRGGDITYHGPGQIVGYPIIDLEGFKMSLKDYIFNLEESIILSLGKFGLNSERLEGATGVWIDPQIPGKSRKICAIGVRASHYVTMHGFALNVNTDLSYFNYINPCGFRDKGVTSIAAETGSEVNIHDVKKILMVNISRVFGFDWDQ